MVAVGAVAGTALEAWPGASDADLTGTEKVAISPKSGWLADRDDHRDEARVAPTALACVLPRLPALTHWANVWCAAGAGSEDMEKARESHFGIWRTGEWVYPGVLFVRVAPKGLTGLRVRKSEEE